MKIISTLILSLFLAVGSISAQPAVNVATDSSSVSLQIEDIDVIAADTVTDEQFDSGDSEFLSEVESDLFNGMEESGVRQEMMRKNMGYVVALVAIVLGVPCVAIVAALIVILTYALKRNKRRNEIIAKAIEYNYQLPDAFYTGQRVSSSSPDAPMRDARKFYSSITFIAIGFSLIIFAITAGEPFFLLCGGIPLLIGIGRLIGYFYIPAAPNYPQYPAYNSCNTPYNSSYNNQEYNNQGSQQNSSDSCQPTPPPYNPQKD